MSNFANLPIHCFSSQISFSFHVTRIKYSIVCLHFTCHLSTQSGVSHNPDKSELLSQIETQMDGRGIEIIVSDENDARVSTVHSGKRAILRRIWTILLDNRIEGRPGAENVVHPHPEEHRVLKRVLNIIFITIGVALLIAVFVVIIYCVVVGEDHMRNQNSSGASSTADKHSSPEENTASTSKPQ